MPTACSAYGCTRRKKRGDNVGMFYFPKDEYLRRLWTIAIRRANWQPTASSRICGEHFHSGKPSKDKTHPDYVPSIFDFNQKKRTIVFPRKIAQKKASKEEVHHGANLANNKELAPKQEDKTTTNLAPVRENMQENDDNIREKKIMEASSNNKSFLTNKEIKPAFPQRVWLLNFIPAKQNPHIPIISQTASLSSVNGNNSAHKSDSKTVFGPLYVKSSMSIDDEDSSLSTDSDDSTLTAKSSISATEDNMLLDAEPYIIANADSVLTDESHVVGNEDSVDVESSLTLSKDSEAYNVESPMANSTVWYSESSVVNSKNASPNSDRLQCVSETITTNKENNISSSTIKPVKGKSDYDYSHFMWSHLDTKEVLAIKLETMLTINVSLQEKIKFYKNRCKLYEKEINDLRKYNKRGPNVVTLKNT